MQIIRTARKEAARTVWSVQTKINKLLYLHNQLGKKRKETMCKNGKSILSKQSWEPLQEDLTPLQWCLTFYDHYRDQSLEVPLHSAFFHILCTSKTIDARMPSVRHHLIAWPCTINHLWRPHSICMRSLELHMCWSNLLVQDNYDLSDNHSEYSSPLYCSISSPRECFGCSSRSSSTGDLRRFECSYKRRKPWIKR
jgi:hypothetical protein